MHNAGRVTFEGRPCYKLNVVTTAGAAMTKFFDTKTGWEAGSILSVDAPQGKVTMTVVAADYWQFGGLLWPTKITRKTAGIQEALTITAVEYDRVPDSIFDPPAKVKALMLR